MDPRREPLFTRSFGLLLGAHFVQALGFSSMLLLPLYLHHLGASLREIGAIVAAANVSGLLVRPGVGWALDRLGRKPTIYAGTGLLVLGMLGVYLVTDLGLVAYADRLLFGVGVAVLSTAYFTLAADLVPLGRRTEGLALFGISGLLPIGPMAFVRDLDVEPADLRLFFPAVGVVIATSLLLVAPVPEPARPARVAADGSALRALTRAPLAPTWLATLVFAALVATFFAFATVAAESRGVARPAGLWLPYAGGAIGVRLVGARLPDRLGPRNLVAPAIALYAAGFVVASGAVTGASFALAGLLAGLGHGFCFPVLASQAVSRTPTAHRGAAMAGFTALLGLAELAAPPLLGLVGDAANDAFMFAVAAVGASGLLVGWAALEHALGPREPGSI